MSLWKRRRRAADPSVEDRIRQVLVALGPRLRIETVAIELVRFDTENGIATLRFSGDCPDCEMTLDMMRDAIEAHLCRRIPELREIRAL